VKTFLESCKFSAAGRDFKQPELLWSYISKKLEGRKWTVVVAGTAVSNDRSNAFEFSSGLAVGKVGRKINKNGGSFVAFKHVTAPVDFVCDINHELDCVPGTARFVSHGIKSSVGYYRSCASLHGKDQTPVLIINCINKEYLNSKCGTSLARDLYGIAFYFPKTADESIGSYTKLRVSNLVADDSSESEV
jgi:hypothetical protein